MNCTTTYPGAIIQGFLRLGATLLLLMTVLALTGCVGTRYVNTPHTQKGDQPIDETVQYDVDRAFWIDSPRCVIILPVEGLPSRARGTRVLEDAFARQLSLKVSRVINRAKRQSLVRRDLLDLAKADQRRLFARMHGCRHALRIRVADAREEFLMVWAHRELALKVELVRIHDDRVVWWASHRTWRGDGGLPFNVVSAPINTVSAIQFSMNKEGTDVLIEDHARRIAATIPEKGS